MAEIKSGEFRTLTAQEFGNLVAMFRKELDWKQIVLAHYAGVDERTVQRIQAGQQVSDDTRRQIARAFRLPEDEFTRPSYMPSEEEVRAKAAEISSKFILVAARPLASPRDFDEILSVSHAYLVDNSALPDSADEEVAGFRDLLQDWSFAFSDATNLDRLNACRSLFEYAQKIAGGSYQTLFGIHATEDERFKAKGITFKIAVITFLPRDRQVTQLVVPRRFDEYQLQ